MACHLSITIHNMMPDKASEGIHVPFHTIVMDPFRKPFTFGPKRCDVKNCSHIGQFLDFNRTRRWQQPLLALRASFW
jgi:hypothetical protein